MSNNDNGVKIYIVVTQPADEAMNTFLDLRWKLSTFGYYLKNSLAFSNLLNEMQHLLDCLEILRQTTGDVSVKVIADESLAGPLEQVVPLVEVENLCERAEKKLEQFQMEKMQGGVL